MEQIARFPAKSSSREEHLKLAKGAYENQDFSAALYFASQVLEAQFDYVAWKYYLLSACKTGNFAALEPIIDMLDETADKDLAVVKFDTFLYFRKLDAVEDLVRGHYARYGFDETARYFNIALGSVRASGCPEFEAWLQELPPPAAASPFWRLVAPKHAALVLTGRRAIPHIYIDVTGTIDHIVAGLPMTGIQRVCISLLNALRRISEDGQDIRLVYEPRLTHQPVSLALDEFCDTLVSTYQGASLKLRGLAAFAAGVHNLGVDYGWGSLARFAPAEGDVIFFPDAFWGSHYTGADAALKTNGLRTAFLLHDLIVLKDREENANRSQNLAFAKAADAVICGADRIIVQSNATRFDVLTYAAGRNRDVRVTTIPFGEENFAITLQTAPADIPAGLAGKRYVLSVGTLSRRKGFVQLARAFHRVLSVLPADVCLVFCGRWSKDLPEYRDIAALIAQAPDRIMLIDGPSDSQLRTLYQGADLAALVSKDEGWGMPVSEALAHGTPLLLSQAGSLPEVAGEAALYVDPDDEAQIGRNLVAFFANPAIAERLREGQAALERRTWDTAARKLISELRAV